MTEPAAPDPQPADLQIKQNLPFQYKSWAAERIAWVGMGLFLLAAALGVFGGGWLAGAEAQGPAGRFTLEYKRFERMDAPTEIKLRCPRVQAQAAEVAVWFARDYIERIRITEISPSPLRTETTAGRVTYYFAAPGPEQPFSAIFFFTMEQAGRLPGRVGLAGAGEASFRQLVYP